MIPDYLVALTNHLWQSSLFAAVVALLTLLLKSNRAAVRYRLWLVASLKFLVPFAVLVSLGSQIPWRTVPRPNPNLVALAWSDISEPFSPSAATEPATLSAEKPDRLPIILICMWIAGALISLTPSVSQFRRIRRHLRLATPLKVDIPIPVMSCPGKMEPGVFGLFHPVLLLPEGITESLSPSEFESILLHEQCHVLRRDNLMAAIHMFIETLFWFHPLVWWMGRRLTEEQERACDEEVLKFGCDPQMYAEGILKVCRLYLTSPLPCVAKVAGSRLRQRIESIMTSEAPVRLGFAKTALLVFAGTTALCGPLLSGPALRGSVQVPAIAKLRFDAASIKPVATNDTSFPYGGCRGFDAIEAQGGGLPAVTGLGFPQTPLGRCIYHRSTLKGLIGAAYGIDATKLDQRILGGSAWVAADRYHIEAIASEPEKTRSSDLRLMFQTLLAERFQLQLHRETREVPGFALVVEGRPKMEKGSGSGAVFAARRLGDYNVRNQNMAKLADALSVHLGQPVIDETGIEGDFTFTLTWTPSEDILASVPPEVRAQWAIDPHGPSLFTALKEQLGLRLESRKVPVEVIVIDAAEKPSEMIAVQVVPNKPLAFEVASIKPLEARPPGPITTSLRASTKNGRMTFDAINLKLLIIQAYDLQADVAIKGPAWMDTQWFTVVAKAEHGDVTSEEVRGMLRTLLEDRFKLVIHRETAEGTIHALVQAKAGAKLKDADPAVPFSATQTPEGLVYQRTRLSVLAATLSSMTRLPIRDMTGLNGIYNFTLDMRLADAMSTDKSEGSAASDPLQGILRLAAPLEALGLKLELRRAPVDSIIIERVERPTPN